MDMPATLANVAIIFADSRQALEHAWAQGCPRGAVVKTLSPALLHDEKTSARALEEDMDAHILADLGRSGRRLSHDLAGLFAKTPTFAEAALTAARTVFEIQGIVYKAMMLRDGDFTQPVATVDVASGSELADLIFNNPFSRILAANEAHRRLVLDDVPPLLEYREAQASLWTRLRFENWQSIVYRGFQKLWTGLPFSGLRGNFLVYSENSLAKETAVHLALRGFGLIRQQRIKPGRQSVPEDEWRDIAQNLRTLFQSWLTPLVNAAAVPGMTDWFVDLVHGRVERFRHAKAVWPSLMGDVGKRRLKGVLAGAAASPETEAFYHVCQEKGLRIYSFEHGTSVEFTEATRHAEYHDDICTSDVFFCFNDEAARVLEDNPFATGQPVTVGQPADMANVGRDRPSLKDVPEILYISTQLFMGNWLNPVSCGLPDREKADYEAALVNKVLALLPHRVMFKPYPSRRFLDPNPVCELARSKANIDLFESFLDLRYFITAPRVLITAHAASTVSWCLMSGKPLVFIDEPHQSPLMPEPRKAFEAGVFLFDPARSDFHESLRAFLSRPITEIEALWREKVPARKALIDTYLGRADGVAGRRAAQWILDHSAS